MRDSNFCWNHTCAVCGLKKYEFQTKCVSCGGLQPIRNYDGSKDPMVMASKGLDVGSSTVSSFQSNTVLITHGEGSNGYEEEFSDSDQEVTFVPRDISSISSSSSSSSSPPEVETGTEDVILECISVNGRLRVRIISEGYQNNLNCTFPKNIRCEGQQYRVNKKDVRLVPTKGKYYYSVKSDAIHLHKISPGDVKVVYGDDETECCICMDSEKEVVFVPCGHYSCCKACAESLSPKKCPVCSGAFSKIVGRDDLNLIK